MDQTEEEAMFCERCGKDLGICPEGNFCIYCGARIVDNKEIQAEDEAVQDRKTMLGKKPETGKRMGEEGGLEKKDSRKPEKEILPPIYPEDEKKTEEQKKRKRRICAAVVGFMVLGLSGAYFYDGRLGRELAGMENVEVLKDSKEWVSKVYPDLGIYVCDTNIEGHIKERVYDDQWQEMLTGPYDTITVIEEAGRIVAKDEGELVLFDMDGTEIQKFQGNVSLEYDDTTGEFYYTRHSGKVEQKGILDRDGNFILENVKGFKELQIVDGVGRRRYQRGGAFGDAWGLVDEKGWEIAPCLYEEIGVFSDDRASVIRDGLAGAIDLNGNEVIPCKYDYLDEFVEGWTRVRKDGTILFLNRDGKVKKDGSKSPFRKIYGYKKGGFLIVGGSGQDQDEDLMTVITVDTFYDRSGHKILVSDAEDIISYEGGVIARKEGLCGIYSDECKELLPAEYDWITAIDGGFCIEKGGLCGFADMEGRIILPPENQEYIRFEEEGSCCVFINGVDDEKKTIAVISSEGKKIGEYQGVSQYGKGQRFFWMRDNEQNKGIALDKEGDIVKEWENVNSVELYEFTDGPNCFYRVGYCDGSQKIGELVYGSEIDGEYTTFYDGLCKDGVVCERNNGYDIYAYQYGSWNLICHIKNARYVHPLGKSCYMLRVDGSQILPEWGPFNREAFIRIKK